MGEKVELHIVTPEAAPLGMFGAEASRELEALLESAGITLHASAHVEQVEAGRVRLGAGGNELQVDRVVSLPRIDGPAIAGLPADAGGFLVTDSHGRVNGAPGVYAAGDITAFPIKQGGIACQLADAAAAQIAVDAGAAVEAAPFAPVLRGILLTERWARFLRRDAGGHGDHDDVAGRALWWPPTKIAGRELAGYLETIDEELGASADCRSRPGSRAMRARSRC